MKAASPVFRSPEAHRAFIEELDFLSHHCPQGRHFDHCPFKLMAGISQAHRLALLRQMDRRQIEALFDLVGECQCPADPRGTNPSPFLESAP
jgi:hypothetical protein